MMTISFDMDAILTAVPGASPAGASLRYSGEYDQIREARRQDDPSLPQGVWQSSLKRADWDAVIRLAVDSLSTRSKDLQIAAWLLEALIHKHGFGGLTTGLSVIDGLCRTFWDDLHPEIDGDDLSFRTAPIDWINEKIPVALHQVSVTRSGTIDIESYSYSDYLNAQRLSPVTSRDPKVAATVQASGQVLLPDFRASAATTPTPFYRAILADIDPALQAVDALSDLLDERCGPAAPSLVGLRRALTDVHGLIDTVLRERGEAIMVPDDPTADPASAEEDEAPMAAPDGSVSDPAVGAGAPMHSGPIRSREEAYFRLAEAADFLFRTEPHSPTPYLIQRAVAWGNMPLHELLIEMSQGRNDLSALFELLGLTGGMDGFGKR